MSNSYTDTHCHINFDTFDADRNRVIERARQAGLIRILIPGVDLETSRSAIRLAEAVPEIYAAVGVHPNSAQEWNSQTRTELKDLAAHPKVVAIGEIGLDYYRDNTSKDLQKEVLLEQLSLAAEVKLPIVLHNRIATDDILDLLSNWQSELKLTKSQLLMRCGVLHSYSEDLDAALTAINLGFSIGINGPVTFKNASNLQLLVKSLPIESILIETDAPFLTPHPKRGQRNEPSYVVRVAEKIAELKGMQLAEVQDITTANAERLFHWREIY